MFLVFLSGGIISKLKTMVPCCPGDQHWGELLAKKMPESKEFGAEQVKNIFFGLFENAQLLCSSTTLRIFDDIGEMIFLMLQMMTMMLALVLLVIIVKMVVNWSCRKYM